MIKYCFILFSLFLLTSCTLWEDPVRTDKAVGEWEQQTPYGHHEYNIYGILLGVKRKVILMQAARRNLLGEIINSEVVVKEDKANIIQPIGISTIFVNRSPELFRSDLVDYNSLDEYIIISQ